METVKELAAGLALVAMSLLLFSLYLAITPDQSSAEADFLREEMEAGR